MSPESPYPGPTAPEPPASGPPPAGGAATGATTSGPGASAAAPAGEPWYRSWLPTALVVAASVLAIAALVSVFAARVALSNTFIPPAASEMLEDPEIRQAISVYAADQVFAGLDVEGELQKALPPRVAVLSGAITQGLEQVAADAVETLLSQPAVVDLFERAVQLANTQLLRLVEGDTKFVQLQDGQVVLDLSPVVRTVAERFGVEGSLPADAGRIVIMSETQLTEAQKALEVLRFVSYWIGPLVIALYLLALWLARGNRRRILMGMGIGLFAAGLSVRIVQRVAGSAVTDSLVQNTANKQAARNAWDILTSAMAAAGLTLVIVGVALWLGAMLAGPGRYETIVRRFLAPALRVRWIALAIPVVVLAIAFAVNPGLGTHRWLTWVVLLAIGVGGMEVLHRQVSEEFPAPPPDAAAPAT